MKLFNNNDRPLDFRTNQAFIWPEMSPQDWIMEVISWIGLAGIFAYVFLHYKQLPASAAGYADQFGNPSGSSDRISLLFLPGIALLFQIIEPLRKRINPNFRSRRFLSRVTTQKQFSFRVRLFRYNKMIVTWGLFYLTTIQFRLALGTSHGVSVWFAPVFCTLLILPLLYYVVFIR